MNTWTFERRTLLGAIGTGMSVGFAGCLSGDEADGQSGGDGGSDDGATDEDGGDDGEDHENGSGGNGDGQRDDDDRDDGADSDGGNEDVHLDEAAHFPEGRTCAVCNMVAAKHPDWNAQLVHEDGHREFFCSSGCMAAYTVAPNHFEGPGSDVVGSWVTAYDTGELVDASTVSFVRVADPDHVDDIMMMNPTPFAERTEAETFVEGFGDYDERDIIELADFDHDLAHHYRSRFLEGDDADEGNGHSGHGD